MKAADVMVTDVITLRPQDTVRDVAATLLKCGISAAPVVDGEGRLVGIVSEGDLIRRAEIGTERRRSWLAGTHAGGDHAFAGSPVPVCRERSLAGRCRQRSGAPPHCDIR
jgi:CBS-domain-containing membrane protein